MSSSETRPMPLTVYQNAVSAKDSVVKALKRARDDMAAYNGSPECVALANQAVEKISRMLSLVENQFTPLFSKKPSLMSRILRRGRQKEAEVLSFYQGLMALSNGLQTIATSAAKLEKKAGNHILHFRLFWLFFFLTVTFILVHFPSKTLMLLFFLK